MSLGHSCFPVDLHHNAREQPVSFSEVFHSFAINWNTFYASTSSSSPSSFKHSSEFFINTEILLILFQIFFSYFECGWNYERNLSTRLFEIKLNHEINLSWNIKKFFSIDIQLVVQYHVNSLKYL